MNVDTFIKQYKKLIANQDWDQLEPLIHPDCVVTFTSGTYKGKNEVENIFRKNFKLIKDEKYEISQVYFVKEASDYAVFIFHYSWSGLINGKYAEGGGRGTSVIVNHNGSWQLISEHLGPHT